MFPVEKRHKVVNILGILAIVVCFALTTAFNALAGSGNFQTFFRETEVVIITLHVLAGNQSVFTSTTGNLSDTYQLSFTPAGFTFSIWGIIYFWLAGTMVLCKWCSGFRLQPEQAWAPLNRRK